MQGFYESAASAHMKSMVKKTVGSTHELKEAEAGGAAGAGHRGSSFSFESEEKTEERLESKQREMMRDAIRSLRK